MCESHQTVECIHKRLGRLHRLMWCEHGSVLRVVPQKAINLKLFVKSLRWFPEQQYSSIFVDETTLNRYLVNDLLLSWQCLHALFLRYFGIVPFNDGDIFAGHALKGSLWHMGVWVKNRSTESVTAVWHAQRNGHVGLNLDHARRRAVLKEYRYESESA